MLRPVAYERCESTLRMSCCLLLVLLGYLPVDSLLAAGLTDTFLSKAASLFLLKLAIFSLIAGRPVYS